MTYQDSAIVEENCGRKMEGGDVFCQNCLERRELVRYAQNKELSEELCAETCVMSSVW